jgi:hypothetical protein
MKITFDHNLLIALEVGQGHDLGNLKRLVSLHDNNQITICVSAIGASERLKDKSYASSFGDFRKRIQGLSIKEFEILRPPIYLDITYWDWCIWGNDETIALEKEIYQTLFPEIEFEWQDYAQSHGLNSETDLQKPEGQKWRNRKCDVLAMWCHIYYACDVFVTNDTNFHRKKLALEKLGAKQLSFPNELQLQNRKS